MEGTVSTVPSHECRWSSAFLIRDAFGMLGSYINEHDLAGELELTVWALRKWRRRGYGPTARKMGKRVMYVRAEVDDFLASLTGGLV